MDLIDRRKHLNRVIFLRRTSKIYDSTNTIILFLKSELTRFGLEKFFSLRVHFSNKPAKFVYVLVGHFTKVSFCPPVEGLKG